MAGASTAPDEPIGSSMLGTIDFDKDEAVATVEHGPTNLPPQPYPGGPGAVSPWKPRKDFGTIPGSAMDYVGGSLVRQSCRIIHSASVI